MIHQSITRRRFLQASTGTLAGILAPSLPGPAWPQPDNNIDTQPAASGKLPNVVFIFADQLRSCSVGCYGNPEVDTPNMDRLAADGALFVHSISTSPVSTPYRACLMTGRYPTATGVFANSFKLQRTETGIAEIFQAHGYQTKFIGKWFLNGPVPDPVADPGWVPPEDRHGFQTWTGFNGAHVYYDGKYYVDDNPTIQTLAPGVYEPDFQTDEAIRFITEKRGASFCLFMSIGTPHPQNIGRDRPPGGDYTYPYDPESMTLRPNVDYADKEYCRREYADYYGITSNFDWNIGRIMDTLNKLKLDNETIMVVASDHGDYVGSQFSHVNKFRGKTTIYTESLNVPCILRYPSGVVPTVVNEVFTPVDVMPTLLRLCKLRVPDNVMGRDFAPRLFTGAEPLEPPYGPVPSTESALIGMFKGQWVGAYTPEYSMACRRKTLLPNKLFHNTNDPYQMYNCVDDPAYQGVLKDLYNQMLDWLEYVGYQDWPR